MANFLKKITRFHSITRDKIKSSYDISVLDIPNGTHLCCVNCHSPFFEVWTDNSNRKITIGCMKCGAEEALVFPFDLDISKLGQGKMTCLRHKKSGMVIIRNREKLCIGCQHCSTEIILELRQKSNLILLN